MKKIFAITIVSITFIAAGSFLYFRHIRLNEIAQQKHILFTQINKCGRSVEETVDDYENELNKIIFDHSDILYSVFSNAETLPFLSYEIERFYRDFSSIISSITVIDNYNNFLGFYMNRTNDFVVDTFTRQVNNILEPKHKIEFAETGYISYFPFFEQGQLSGNIIVEVDLKKYLQVVFDSYHIPGYSNQWLLNDEGTIMVSNFESEFSIPDLEAIQDTIRMGKEGSIIHKIKFKNQFYNANSAIYPLRVLGNRLAMVFTLNTGRSIIDLIYDYKLFFAIASLFFLSLIAYLLILLRKNKKIQDKDKTRLIRLLMILENFPIGILVLDEKGNIKIVNRAAQDMLFVRGNTNIVGRNFEKVFRGSDSYLLGEHGNSGFDSNHLMHYTYEGNEIVIYRKDIVKQIRGEALTITALMDVSPIEKSRKREAAANQAKSDFLAKMSHEIRAPMSGIIGMTESLILQKPDDNLLDQIKVIQKSGELLLNIINDILDFSKIEAGKMMIEQIPFSLSDELTIIRELFKPLFEEKKIGFTVVVSSEVPDKFIGDPFRLRQIITNLLSNSVKFTKEGRVQLHVSILEQFNHVISLLFSVEDTGIGIPKEKRSKIFNSYEQEGSSISRKYGGTGLGMAISRQLAELMNGEIWIQSPSSIATNEIYPGTRVSFSIEVESDEKLQKHYHYSYIKSYEQIRALILTRKRDENDKVHLVFDNFGISYKYLEYDNNSMDSLVQHLSKNEGEYHLLVIKDKPSFDGFKLALKFKEKKISQNYPIIFISSNDKKGNYRKCKKLMVDYYLIQPYDKNEIFDILKEVFMNISHGKVLSESINQIKPALNILIAEDNILNQKIVQSLFKHIGHEVSIAENGDEAVKMSLENDYDLILMDILMPVMDGITATRKIRKAGSTPVIVAMTGSDESEKKEEAIEAGMNDYITKPIRVEAIKHTLIKWFSVHIDNN